MLTPFATWGAATGRRRGRAPTLSARNTALPRNAGRSRRADLSRRAGLSRCAHLLRPALLLPLALLPVLLVLPSGCDEEQFDEAAFVASFKKIHENIYSIYRLKEGGAVYDTLAKSCAGEELEREVYEYLKCLRVQDELKTFISIVDVIYNDVRVRARSGGSVEVYCKWVVIGKVRHPTHIHRKVNLNEALYRVRAVDGAPRIVGYDLLTNQAVEAIAR